MRRVAVICALLVTLAPLGEGRSEQVGRRYRIGYLTPWYSTSDAVQRLAFVEGLRARGHREGEELVFESRYAEGKLEQLPELAGQLVQRQVDVIVAVSIPAGLAAKGVTSTIPIVVAANGDLVDSGLVTDAARPGGNVTGIQFLRPEVALRQMEILTQLVPGATRLAYLGDPDVPSDLASFRALQAQASSLRATIQFLPAKAEPDYRVAFSRMVEQGIQGLVVGASVTRFDASRSVVRLAARHKIPAMHPGREFVEAGGLASYFANAADRGRLVAIYVDKILRGARPGDLRVEQYSRYELIINLRTARTLGLTVPPSLRAQAASVLR